MLALALLLPSWGASGQDASPQGPVYIVQEGDTLWTIALRFGVSMDEIQAANGMGVDGYLGAGDELVIPGVEGFDGVLTTEEVALGDNLRSLSRRTGVPLEVLARINRLTNPGELYVGASLIRPAAEDQPAATDQPEATGQPGASHARVALSAGQSFLELAVLSGENPWKLAAQNRVEGLWSPLPGDIFFSERAGNGSEEPAGPGALPGFIRSLSLSPSTLEQGRVAVVEITGPEGMTLSGTLGDTSLNFFQDGKNRYAALQGIHAMAEPGLYTLSLEGTLPGAEPSTETPFSFSQAVFVRGGGYPMDPVLTVSPETIDPAITKPEDEEWLALVKNFSAEKLWDGVFESPVPPEFSECWPSSFGSRRSYNGSAYQYFHSGLDFCGGVGTDIFAPAAGVVIFAGPLTVRGNATMIDHGWGVYTGYMHQSEILVEVGDRVEPGQLIGKVGATGRVTGPHLHWEVFAGGVQVDPMEWLEDAIP